jgi:hypothetical protein
MIFILTSVARPFKIRSHLSCSPAVIIHERREKASVQNFFVIAQDAVMTINQVTMDVPLTNQGEKSMKR